MKIQSNYPQYANVNNTTSFKSLYMTKRAYQREQKFIKGTSSKIAGMISEPTEKVYSMIKDVPEKRFYFFETLADRYNSTNFHLEGTKKESSKFIFHIFDTVTKPTALHSQITRRHDGTMETLGKIFELAQTKDTLEYVQKLQRKVLGTSEECAVKIVDLLSSKHSKEYVEEPKRYVSYLTLTKNNPNAVKELDDLIDNNLYDYKKYDAELGLQDLIHKEIFGFSDKSKTELKDNYSKDRRSFLKVLSEKISMYHKELVRDSETDILDMYKSTNKDNSGLRVDVISEFMNPSEMQGSAKTEAEELKALKTVFEKMDMNEDVTKFVQKALDRDLKVSGVSELDEIISTVPIKKASIFIDNLGRILSMSKGEERKKALINSIEDPFFIPESGRFEYLNSIKYGFRQKEGKFTKLIKSIQNKFNQYKYNKIKDDDIIVSNVAEIKTKEVVPEVIATPKKTCTKPEMTVTPVAKKKEYVKPEMTVTTVAKKKEYVKPEMTIKEQEIKKTETPAVTTVVKEPEVEKLEPLSVKLENKKPEPVAVAVEPEPVITKPEIKKPSVAKSKVKKQKPAAAKPKVKQQKPVIPEVIVPNVVDPTINTVNKIPTVFNQKESKMFSYIRGQLGDKINSNNKELVTYMIKHQDANGRSSFKANDIIDLINKEENYIRKQKRLNFKYDVKAYYSDLLDMMKEEYGVVK